VYSGILRRVILGKLTASTKELPQSSVPKSKTELQSSRVLARDTFTLKMDIIHWSETCFHFLRTTLFYMLEYRTICHITLTICVHDFLYNVAPFSFQDARTPVANPSDDCAVRVSNNADYW
jgi:hypothetical protein